MYKIGLPGKSILGNYFQENKISRTPFLLLRISFPGRPILIQFVPVGGEDGGVPQHVGLGVAGQVARLLLHEERLHGMEDAAVHVRDGEGADDAVPGKLSAVLRLELSDDALAVALFDADGLGELKSVF